MLKFIYFVFCVIGRSRHLCCVLPLAVAIDMSWTVMQYSVYDFTAYSMPVKVHHLCLLAL